VHETHTGFLNLRLKGEAGGLNLLSTFLVLIARDQVC